MGLFGNNAQTLNAKADKQAAKAAATGNGSYLARAADLRARADKAADRAGRAAGRARGRG